VFELLNMNPEWPIDTTFAKRGKFRKFGAKYPREYASLFGNLEKVLRILRQGSRMHSFQIGFFRSEGGGVFRIGQTGVPSAKESRLYVYPNEQNHTMYLLTIGTKDGQSEDINEAKALASQIKSEPTGV
jgi:putative component of toxin-antitoxin plasmid stabilization module